MKRLADVRRLLIYRMTRLYVFSASSKDAYTLERNHHKVATAGIFEQILPTVLRTAAQRTAALRTTTVRCYLLCWVLRTMLRTLCTNERLLY